MTQTEKGSFEQLATQVVELNLRYYRALGEATMDYVRSVLAFAGDRSPFLRNAAARARQAASSVAASASGTAADAATAVAAAAQPAAAPAVGAVVLEGRAGEQAAGGFVVNNRLARRVSAAFRVSAFAGPRGEVFSGVLHIDPPVLTLEPGMQTLVRITATIDPALAVASDYRGTISVPGLADAPIDVIIRRRADAAADAPPAKAPERAAPKARTKSAPAASTRRPPRGSR